MTEAAKLLERQTAIRDNMSPTGVQIRVHKVPNSSLFKAARNDGGHLPYPLDGMFTDPHKCQASIENLLKELWDESDRIQLKAEDKKLKRQKAEEKKTKEAEAEAQ